MKVLINEHPKRLYLKIEELRKGDLFIMRQGSRIAMFLHVEHGGGNRVHDAIRSGNKDGYYYYVLLDTGVIGAVENRTEVERYDGILTVELSELRRSDDGNVIEV